MAKIKVENPVVELDGDEFGLAARIRCRVDQGGLLIAAPAGHRLAPRRP